MKAAAALLASFVLATAAIAQGDQRPAIGIERALALAQAHLVATGQAGTHWIASLTLERETIMDPNYHWFAKWQKPILLEGRRELGLQINMDGSVARTVDKKARK